MRSSSRLRSATKSGPCAGGVAGPREVDGDLVHDLARARAHHIDAVGEEHRLVDVVGDEDHGLAQLAPDVEQPLLHEQARLGIESSERLVEQQDVAREEHRANERGALPHAARELARQCGEKLAEAEALAQFTASLACLAPGTPSTSSPTTVLSSTERQGMRLSRCGMYETWPVLPVTTWPWIETSPAVGRRRPAMIWNSVDLPQPEGPSRTTNSAPRASMLTCWSAVISRPRV